MLFDQFGTESKFTITDMITMAGRGNIGLNRWGYTATIPFLPQKNLLNIARKEIEMSRVLKMCVLSNRWNNKFHNTYAKLIFTIMQEFVTFKDILDSVHNVLLKLYISHVSTDFNWQPNIPVVDVFEDA